MTMPYDPRPSCYTWACEELAKKKREAKIHIVPKPFEPVLRLIVTKNPTPGWVGEWIADHICAGQPDARRDPDFHPVQPPNLRRRAEGPPGRPPAA